jgi:hypothetical protein
MTNLSQRIITRLLKKLWYGKFRYRLMFLHIPKCGGTSIVQALEACYGPRVLDPTQFYLDPAAVFETAGQFNQRFHQVSETLLLYIMAQKQYRFITGHFFFSQKAHQQYGRRWQTITVLREPVSRWFSQYFFNRYKQNPHFKIDTDLETYLESNEGIGVGRTLMNVLEGSGRDWEHDPEKGMSRAISNLRKISLVGFLEHLEQFQSSFKERFGYDLKIGTYRKNPSPWDERKKQMTTEVIEKVQHICRYDSRIYQYAIDNFLKASQDAAL